MSKISDLNLVGDMVSTDQLLALRSGANVRVNVGDLTPEILQHNGSTKLTATSTGIDVTGTVTADGLQVTNTATTGTNQEVASFRTASGGGLVIRSSDLSSANPDSILEPFFGESLKIKTSGNDRFKIQDNGDISFYNSAGSSQSLFWDASAESLGIGTSSPDGLLDIEGNFESNKALVLTNTQGTGKVSYIRSHGGNGESLSLYHDGSRRQLWDSSGYTSFENGGAERLRIGSAGQIGLSGANYGTSGQVLTSNGGSSAPTWQDASGGSIDGTTINPSSVQISGTTVITSSREGSFATRAQFGGIDSAGNVAPSFNNTIISGYGLIGNRGTMYITNGGGVVQLGNGSTHNDSPGLTVSTTAVNLGSSRALQMNGTTIIDSSRNVTTPSVYINDTNTHIHEGFNNAARIQTNNGYIDIGAQNTSHAHIYTDRPSFYFNKSFLYANGNLIWHEGNDGSGSGLDADLLDGYDSSRFMRRQTKATATAGPGWMTVATCTGGRHHGEVVVTDADSGDHAIIRVEWLRSYGDSAFTVLNCGGHANRITGTRVLYQSADNTYGVKLLQVYVNTSSTYEVNVFELGDIDDYSVHTAVTPVIEDSKTGYAVHGNSLEGLDAHNLAAEEGILAGGVIDGMGGFDVNGTNVIDTSRNLKNINSVEIGTKVTLQESTDRADLLQITGSTTAWSGIQIRNSSSEGRWSFMTDGNVAGIYDDENSEWYMQWNEHGATEIFHNNSQKLTTTSSGISVTGNIVASANITAYSDRRVKANLEPVTDAVAKVNRLNGLTYTRTDLDDTETRYAGLIAQEVESVLPEAVVQSGGRKSLDYNGTIALLVEAVKELSAEVAELKAKQ